MCLNEEVCVSCRACNTHVQFEVQLKSLLKQSVDWIGLARDRERWRAIVNAVMNLRIQ
jgi:hypothetical protein